MMKSQRLPWSEPLDMAATIDEAYWVLLYSGVRTSYSGRYSYLAHHLAEHIEAADFAKLASKVTDDQPLYENAWFGYLGYGLKNSLEQLTVDQKGTIDLPDLCMMRFDIIYQFDHEEKIVTRWAKDDLSPANAPKSVNTPVVSQLHSNMSRGDYLEKAAHVIERIHAGDLYQANLTRKFGGEFSETPDAFSLFKKLCAVSPAPYSAYMRLNDSHILSSSPELFLHIDDKGHVRTRPIKGTAPRFADERKDKASRDALANSAKDKAENLMIVDLMRNDLSRSCEPGSMEVKELFEVTTHATIHHMSSTVVGNKQPDMSTLDVVKYCFPPGSMTGAPKIKAMQLCSQLETLARGIYSGAIGWFGGNGSAEFSVVIRTLILQGKQFEFQVGGGIVADSTPEGELTEHIEKSKGILSCLGMVKEKLEQL